MALINKVSSIFISTIVFSIFLFYVQGQSDVCLSCICEASTRCNASAGCSVDQTGNEFCGPFLMSLSYWEDAGSAVLRGDSLANPNAFKNCAQDFQCSATVVRNYMTKFSQDCNADQRVDCQDFAQIHVYGGYGCSNAGFQETLFSQRFQQCMQNLVAAQPSLL